jgi:sulfite exporter TauE/SafE
MTPDAIQKLDQMGISKEMQERAKMLWLITLLGGLWGWIICNFVWKIEGQESNAWYQHQLKQAMIVGGVGWLLTGFGFGWFINAIIGFLGFSAIGKGDDFEAPVFGGMAK